jgi:hypothetical protein
MSPGRVRNNVTNALFEETREGNNVARAFFVDLVPTAIGMCNAFLPAFCAVCYMQNFRLYHVELDSKEGSIIAWQGGNCTK